MRQFSLKFQGKSSLVKNKRQFDAAINHSAPFRAKVSQEDYRIGANYAKYVLIGHIRVLISALEYVIQSKAADEISKNRARDAIKHYLKYGPGECNEQ